MNRLLVALLAAFDALVAAAVGLVAALAPLTVLWVVGFGGEAAWSGLWPTAGRLWQVGHLVPLHLTLPPEYLAAAGISADAATFTLSLAPLAFAAFTAIAGARSGARAARAGGWLTGVVAGAAAIAAVAVLVRLSTSNSIAAVYTWQAVLLPVLVFAVPAVIAAVAGAWRQGDDGLIDDLRVRIEARAGWGGAVPATAVGIAIGVVGFIGAGAIAVAVGFALRGGEVAALYELAHVDGVGATVLTLAQFAYLPTLIVWGGSFVAGPGFALGVGTHVSPGGTSLGVVPGIPVLGIVPESGSAWWLLSVLLIIGVGFVAGWAARVRMTDADMPARGAVVGAVAFGSGIGVAVLCAVASGSIGPERLSSVGPAPLMVGLAVAALVGVGAAVALLTPARRSEGASAPEEDREAASSVTVWTRPDEYETVPIEPLESHEPRNPGSNGPVD